MTISRVVVLAICTSAFTSPADPFAPPQEVVQCTVPAVTGKVYLHRLTVLASFPAGGTLLLTVPVNRTLSGLPVSVSISAPVHDGYAARYYQARTWS